MSNRIGTTDEDLPDMLSYSAAAAKGEKPPLRMLTEASLPSDWLKLWRPGVAVTPGFWDMPEDVYHSQVTLDRPALSSGIARTLIAQSPRHAWNDHPKLGAAQGDDPTKEMDAGSIAHKLILGKGCDFAVGDFDTYRTKDAKEFRDAARASHKIPVLACKLKDIGEMVGMAEKQIRTSDAKSFYSPAGHSEVVGICEMDGVLCQCLFDRLILANGTIYDLKCTTNVHPKAIAAKIAQMGYHIQAAFYKRMLEVLVPDLAGRVSFTFVFIETSAPHVCASYTLSGEFEAIGNFQVNRALDMWRECLAANDWPAYGHAITQVLPPAWMMNEEIAAAF